MKFQSKKPHYEHLRNKWADKHRSLQNKIWDKHKEALNWVGRNIPGRQLALGSLSGLMLLTTPATNIANSHLLAQGQEVTRDSDNNILLAGKLKEIMPKEVRALTSEEEAGIGKLLSDGVGAPVSAELQGIRLNRSYGVIGGEQHLYRYPGDNLYKHTDSASDSAMYIPAGIAPGLGAWGYFAPSEAEFTERDKQREKYYLAVQTFLAPGFAENVGKYRDFFKFRKVVVVNPETGQAVVAVIGDAGPAAWTGKHLGGSPEVMHHVGLAGGPRKGPVLYFFVDDPEDIIPLGPLRMKEFKS